MIDPMKYALAHLHEGKPGTEQPHRVRWHIRALEQAGLVAWKNDGWWLTEAGRKALEVL